MISTATAKGPARLLVAFDLETTGLSAATDRIVEVGAVRFEPSGRELDRFARLVHPGRPMPPAAQTIHGISDAALADASPASTVLPEFLNWLGDPGTTTLLAHNAVFDAAFLGRELARAGRSMPGHAVIDTLALARRRLPGAPNHRLDTLARLLGFDPDGPHRALADSLRVKALWLALAVDAEPAVAYPIHDPNAAPPAPLGWDRLAEAIALGHCVQIQYNGGTRGSAPRAITPRRFLHKGGRAYLIAYCHLGAAEKAFRLDRVRAYEVIGKVQTSC
ncbi:MAG: exonuclease domain-containing protein [Isosphaeraceae bacterium]